MSKQNIMNEIVRVSMAENADPCMMLAMAKFESTFNPNARNGSYAGLFQLSNGVGGCTGDSRYNVAASTKCAIRYINYNKVQLEKAGFIWQPVFAYLCHQQGLTGARKLLEAMKAGYTIGQYQDKMRGGNNVLLRNAPNGMFTKNNKVADWFNYWNSRFEKEMQACSVACPMGNAPAENNSDCVANYNDLAVNKDLPKQSIEQDTASGGTNKKANYYLRNLFG